VVLQVLLGGHCSCSRATRPPDGLHYLYGVLPLFFSLPRRGRARRGPPERELTELDFDALPADRQRSFALAIVRRETGIMAMSALVVFALALRAAGTSGKLF